MPLLDTRKTKIVALEADLGTADAALEKSRTDVQQLNMQKGQLQTDLNQKLQETEQAHRRILEDYNKAKTDQGALQSKLDTVQTQLLQAQSRLEEHERQIGQLRRELADAQSSVEQARKAAADARTQAAAQVQHYSKHIEQLDQSNVLKQRKDMLARKKEEAQAYIQQQRSKQPIRANRTSLDQ